MISINEELIRKQELELWEAIRQQDSVAYAKYIDLDAVMICGSYRCTGEEYILAMPRTGLKRYTIEQYETVASTPILIQNYYTAVTKTLKLVEEAGGSTVEKAVIEVFHVSSTWKRLRETWKLIFHIYAISMD